MFEHFTFGARPQARFDEEGCPSPTDTCVPTPPRPLTSSKSAPRTGYDDLIDALSGQSLQQRSHDMFVQKCVAASSNSFNLEVDFDDEDPTFDAVSETSSSSRPSSPPLASAAEGSTTDSRTQLQRQLNVQMQTSSTHRRDLDTLVDNMIANDSQCTLRRHASRAYLTSRMLSSTISTHNSSAMHDETSAFDDIVDPLTPDQDQILVDLNIDEGFCDDDDDDDDDFNTQADLELSLSMAGTPSGIRKGFEYARAGKSVDILPGGQVKTRPRMRMRKVKVSRPAAAETG